MVAQKSLESQLTKLKLRFIIFGRGESKELAKILNPGETIIHCVHGYYHGGSGLLVATDSRLFLIDKRPFFLNLEEMKYKSIRSADITQGIFQATVTVRSSMNQLVFRSASDARLKALKNYILDRIQESAFSINGYEQTEISQNWKPYLDPAWRPHHSTMLSRRRLNSKFPRIIKAS
jgi:hypothetical protein